MQYVSTPQVGARVRLADRGQGALQGLNGVEDGAQEADLAFGAGFGDGDGEWSLYGHRARDGV